MVNLINSLETCWYISLPWGGQKYRRPSSFYWSGCTSSLPNHSSSSKDAVAQQDYQRQFREILHSRT
ncbi:hypothetical protein H6H03_37940 [Nostoc paludosum FACHB-159]|uniref:Uncharacterized protein n=1 Tax=Nostoc paludosum FACHB-159 TaxID=2692908 RepID=A0ABR8KLU1_9NOSO|nr:hypothetical protein [Nostoc paludosum FACHB-159]